MKIKAKWMAYVRYQVVFVVLIILFCCVVVANINSGSVAISVPEILDIIFNKNALITSNYNILWKIRLPRLMTAAVLGGGLSISGFLLQTFFRNPIAGPYVLGISSGAKMTVAFAMIIATKYHGTFTSLELVLAAFVGSLVSMFFVLTISKRVQSISMLLVAGIMIGYICSAFTDFFIAFANEYQVTNIYTWALGSFSGASWTSFKFAATIIFTVSGIVFLLSKPIGAYLLGESYAQSLGVNIKWFRIALILFSSLLSATVTAFAGPISFIGIAVPHMTKMLLKTTKPILVIPAAFICGSTFCMFCDLIARTAFSPTELSISTVTAVFGAPIVISLMLKRQSNPNNT
ncbi:iron ABC transporter permease [Fusibacter sp. 3D3]|uniref:FecCD family ABC transporter permease n=1 Tax=Fusibacter sp. 3D3 TaxID=1048380 RepID=UPI000852A930|nr:iron ABC transporter permease [Fusibacter sp. 3D3]GAU76146.1 vitamin B12 ABC transporter permease component BtuC [Fusibacter sp. 3D3]